MMRSSRLLSQSCLAGALALLLGLTLLPFCLMLLISQKTNGEIYQGLWTLPGEFRIEFYTEAYRFIIPYIMNSVIVGAVSVAAAVALSSLSGYVFARIHFGGKKALFMALLALMMVPGALTLVPAFLWYKEFPFAGGNDWLGLGGSGFLNTWWVLIIPYVTGSQVLGVFLCRTFFQNLPESLFEAARLDGATEFSSYWRIALPLCKPILATLAIMVFLTAYNDYIWPSVTITDKALLTFSAGVTQFGLEGNLTYGPLMAGYVVGSLPLVMLFLFGMRYYVEGLTSGALKA